MQASSSNALLEHSPSGEPTIRAKTVAPLLLGGAQALWVDGDLRASRGWFDAAYRVAEDDGDVDAMAMAVLGQTGLWVHEHRDSATAMLAESRLHHVAATIDARSVLALRLRARIAAEVDYRTGASATIAAVIDEARATADPIAWAETLNMAHHCMLGPDHSAARQALTRELILTGLRTARRSDLLLGLLRRAVDLFMAGDPHAERGLAELRGMLNQQNHLAIGYVVRAIDVMLDIRAGRLTDAESGAEACAGLGRTAGDADADGWHGAQLVTIRWYQGRLADLLPELRELTNSPTLSAVDNSILAALAVAEATAGNRREAVGALARLRGRSLASMPRSSSWLVTMYGIVEAAHLLEDEAISAAAYELLLPFAHLPLMAGLGMACLGSVQQALGIASMTTGRYDNAVDHFRSAVEDNTALGHWPATAHARARLAQALIRRDRSGDAEEAVQGWKVAEKEAAGMGMRLIGDLAEHAVGDGERGDDRQLPTFAPRGRQWEVRQGTRRAVVEHSLGIAYLAALVANPGYEIPAVDLAAGPGMATPVAVESAGASTQPVLDQAAKQAYKRRLAELSDDLDEYELMNDTIRAERTRVERDWLIAELTASMGLAGKVRDFANSDERARISVTKAIHRAINKIADANPAIGESLRASVRTGLRCSYLPL